jgi:outer membrane usher protein
METSLGGSSDAVRLGMRGAVGRLKGLGFVSRRIDNGAFAVVRVGDVAGAEVSLSNQVVAKTNRKGLALVTGLLPYQSNALSLDSDNLPLEAEIGGVHATTVPYARSGSYIEFPVIRSRNALVVLTQADGSPVPAGARVSLGPGLAAFTVAQRGEVYLTEIADENQLDVHWIDGACTATLRSGALSTGPIASTSLVCGGTK